MSKASKKMSAATDLPPVDTLGDNQIAESRGLLEQMERQTSEIITKVRTHTDQLENQRRIGEEKMQRDRAKKIQNEVITSHKKNVEIDWTWQELEEKEDCEELDKDIQVQKEACKAIINQKEDLIKVFMKQLQEKDDEYVKACRKQSEDIDQLIKGMAKQYEDARTDYADNLTSIERAFTHERQAVLQRNETEIKRLFKEHQDLEEDYQNQKDEKEKGFMNELEKLKTQQADTHASTKIRLEKEMQTLQKCMEEMKAVYNLNQEKLDFNFKVLKDKKTTSHTMKEKLRIQARRKNDTFIFTRDKYKKLTDTMSRENARLSSDYKKFTRYFLILQKKFESFERSDKERYSEILRMNQGEVKNLCQKIMDCDKRIHEQQLGIAWQAPTDPIFKFQDGAMGGTSQGPGASMMDSSKHGESGMNGDGGDNKSEATAGDMDNADLAENFHRVKNVFDILIEEAGYLIDDKAYKMCEGRPNKEKFLIMIDAIRKSLSIDTMDDIKLLVDTFYEYGPKKKERLEQLEKERQEAAAAALLAQTEATGGKKDDKSKKKKDEDKAKKEAEEKKGDNGKTAKKGKDEPLEIPADVDEFDEDQEEGYPPDFDRDDTVHVLDEFIAAREAKRNQMDNMGQPAVKKKSNFEDAEAEAERQKRDERAYWERVSKVLTDKGTSVWRALDKALTKYHGLLVERQNLIEETGLLNQQNEELKTLLNQYLQAGVNHDLQVPPTQVIRLDI